MAGTCSASDCNAPSNGVSNRDRLEKTIERIRPEIERSIAQIKREDRHVGAKAARLLRQMRKNRKINWDGTSHTGPAENPLDANDGVSKNSWGHYAGDSLTALNPATFLGCLEPLEIDAGPYEELCALNCPAAVTPGPGCRPGVVPNPHKVITYWFPVYQIISGLKAGAPSLNVMQFFPPDNAPELLRSATSLLHGTINKAAVKAIAEQLGLDTALVKWPSWHRGEPFQQQQLESFDPTDPSQSFQLGAQTNLHVQTSRDRPRLTEAWKGFLTEPRCLFSALDRPEKKIVTNATYHGSGLYWLLANVPELTQLVAPQMYHATVQLPYSIESARVSSPTNPLAPSFRALRWPATFAELTHFGITPGELEPWHRRSVFYGGEIAPFNVTRFDGFTDPLRADIFRAATAAFLFGSRSPALKAVNRPHKRHLQFTYLKADSGAAANPLKGGSNKPSRVFVDKLQVVFPQWISPAGAGQTLGQLPGFEQMDLSSIAGAADALIGSIPALGDLPLGAVPGLPSLSLGEIPGLGSLALGDLAQIVPVNLGQLFHPNNLLGQIPGLGELPISEIPGLAALGVGSVPGLGTLPLGQIPGMSGLNLSSLPGLGDLPFSQLPILSGVTLGQLPNLASLPISSVPGLIDIRLGDFIAPLGNQPGPSPTLGTLSDVGSLTIGSVDGLAEALIAGQLPGVGSLPTLPTPALEARPLSAVPGLLDLPLAQAGPLLDLPLSAIPGLSLQPLGSLPAALTLPVGSIPGLSSLSPAQLGVELPLSSFPQLLNLPLSGLPGYPSLSLGELGLALDLTIGDVPGLSGISLGQLPGIEVASIFDFPSLTGLPLSQLPDLIGTPLSELPGALDALLGDFPALLVQPLGSIPGLLAVPLSGIPGLSDLPQGAIPGLGPPLFPGSPASPVPNMRLGSSCFRPEDVHNGEDPAQSRLQGRLYVPKDLRKRYLNRTDLEISGETRVLVWTKRVVCACAVCGREKGCLTLNDGDNFEDTIEGRPVPLTSPFIEALPLMYKAAAASTPKPPWTSGNPALQPSTPFTPESVVTELPKPERKNSTAKSRRKLLVSERDAKQTGVNGQRSTPARASHRF